MMRSENGRGLSAPAFSFGSKALHARAESGYKLLALPVYGLPNWELNTGRAGGLLATVQGPQHNEEESMFVTALKSFEHNGTIRRGAVFECSPCVAHDLKRAGFVTINDESINPILAGALPPSASPPAQVLPQAIVKQSESGDIQEVKRKRGRPKRS